jgi:hypothetical protein
MDYNYVNTITDKVKGKKKFPDAIKNQSSVGNPILISQKGCESAGRLTADSEKPKRSVKAQSTADLAKTTGNMHFDHIESNVE